MAAKTRVGVIGAGGVARAHAQALSRLREVTLAAFCDADPARAAAIAEQYGAQSFTAAAAMLDHAALDAAYVCLPPFAHGVELELIERGLPFFIEKPIHLELAPAQDIATRIKAKKLITGVGYMHRYRRGVNMVKALLDKDPPILLNGGWICPTPRPSAEPRTGAWWVRKRESGGQFLEQVTHTVDLARFFCGDALEVHAYAARGFNSDAPADYDLEDASVVNIKFAGGAVANLWASCASNAYSGVALNVYANDLAARFSGWEHSVRVMRVGKDTIEVLGEGDIFAIEDAAFIKAVRARDRSSVLSSYEDAVRTLAVTVAANRSMKTGKPVPVAGAAAPAGSPRPGGA